MDTHFINNDANPIETNQVMWMNHIQSLNPEQLVNLLTQLEDMWDIPRKNDEAVSFQLGFKNFFAVDELDSQTGLPKNMIDIESISAKHQRLNLQLGQLYHRANALKLLDLDDFDETDDTTMANGILLGGRLDDGNDGNDGNDSYQHPLKDILNNL